MTPPARLRTVVLDCPNPLELAEFYRSLIEADGDSFRVYLDPVGHPFCLCWD